MKINPEKEMREVSELKSYSTAISRSSPSAPLTLLEKMGLVKGRVLDYGCGRGDDGRYLMSKGISIDFYDPYWYPESLNYNLYDTILCTYVLNVLPKEDEASIIYSVQKHLRVKGKAYLTVRRDVKQDGATSRGYQRNVLLDLPIVKEKKNNYCIYKLNA